MKELERSIHTFMSVVVWTIFFGLMYKYAGFERAVLTGVVLVLSCCGRINNNNEDK